MATWVSEEGMNEAYDEAPIMLSAADWTSTRLSPWSSAVHTSLPAEAMSAGLGV